jgi:hypothetical protein
VEWSGTCVLCRYLREWSRKNSHGQFVAVFMYQAAPAAGAKLINPLPEVAGFAEWMLKRASSMNFEVNIVGRFLIWCAAQ